ncbi:hypothetical protein HYQ46_006224 [Verticillium longisporum]|nr:hypothetical protein HYQ46_006224 [Verticillium longisporum]
MSIAPRRLMRLASSSPRTLREHLGPAYCSNLKTRPTQASQHPVPAECGEVQREGKMRRGNARGPSDHVRGERQRGLGPVDGGRKEARATRRKRWHGLCRTGQSKTRQRKSEETRNIRLKRYQSRQWKQQTISPHFCSGCF